MVQEKHHMKALSKVKPRCERGDPVDQTGKPGWGGKDSSLDHPRVHWCCQVCQGTPVFLLDKSEGQRQDQSNGDVNAQISLLFPLALTFWHHYVSDIVCHNKYNLFKAFLDKSSSYQ